MSQSKLMSFFSSATEKRKRDSDDSDESQPGPSTPKKTSSDIYNDTTSISCKRSVCDPLKLKMTPKVSYLGVTMTPENFFEGKTLTYFFGIWWHLLQSILGFLKITHDLVILKFHT